jgi:hypothetical protein
MENRIFSTVFGIITLLLYLGALGVLVYGILVIYRVVH